MIIVIDGYNLLKTIKGNRENSQKEKRQLIVELGLYARRKKHILHLVFDGGQTRYPSQEKTNSITIVHAGYEESADDYIKSFIMFHKNKELLLVSSDNELIGYASKHECYSVDSASFASLLKQKDTDEHKNTTTGQLYKLDEDNKNSELDRVMLEESENIHEEKNEALTNKRSRSSSTLKKREKQWLKILKKL